MAFAPPPAPGRGVLSKVREFISKIPVIGAVTRLPENTRVMVDEWFARLIEYGVDSVGSPLLSAIVNGVGGGILTGLGIKEGDLDGVVIGNYLLTRLLDLLTPDQLSLLQANANQLLLGLKTLDLESIKNALIKKEIKLPFSLPKLPAPAPSPAPAPAPAPAPEKLAPVERRRFR